MIETVTLHSDGELPKAVKVDMHGCTTNLNDDWDDAGNGRMM